MPLARILALLGGFIAGVIAQLLFILLLNRIIGPIPAVLSGKMLLWLIILTIPPLTTYMFVTLNPGTLQEDFVQGIQVGALFAFLLILLQAFA